MNLKFFLNTEPGKGAAKVKEEKVQKEVVEEQVAVPLLQQHSQEHSQENTQLFYEHESPQTMRNMQVVGYFSRRKQPLEQKKLHQDEAAFQLQNIEQITYFQPRQYQKPPKPKCKKQTDVLHGANLLFLLLSVQKETLKPKPSVECLLNVMTYPSSPERRPLSKNHTDARLQKGECIYLIMHLYQSTIALLSLIYIMLKCRVGLINIRGLSITI